MLILPRKGAVRLGLVLGVLIAVGLSLFLLPQAEAPSEPFTISERTEYGISSNDVYLTFTNLGEAQTIKNVTFVFADSSKTRTIDVSGILEYKSYQADVYGLEDVAKGTVSRTEKKTIDDGNATGTVKSADVYYDDSGGLLDCDSVKDGKCIKSEKAVVGKETKYDYLPSGVSIVPKHIESGKDVKHRADTGLDVPKNGEAKIRISMAHVIFYGITVEPWENKYNVTACSELGCVTLDPVWYGGGCNARWNVTYTGGAGLANYPVNFTFNVSAAKNNVTNMWLVDSTNASVPYTTMTPPLAGVPNTTFVHNYTAANAPYSLYNCSGIGQAAYYNLSSFGNISSTNWDYGTDGAGVAGSGGGWTSESTTCKFTTSSFYSGSTKGNVSVIGNVQYCIINNVFPIASNFGKYQFRFMLLNTGAEALTVYMR